MNRISVRDYNVYMCARARYLDKPATSQPSTKYSVSLSLSLSPDRNSDFHVLNTSMWR